MHTSSHVYTPTLHHKNLRVDAEITSKGGVLPCLNASFLAGNTTLPPAEFLQETEMQRTSAHEKYYGPSDVWLDTQVLDYIRKGSTAADLPSHDIRRVTRRAKNYLMHDDKLFRLFDSGERKEVPPPHARAEIVRYMHEQHGHFGSRRTVNLMYPNFFWSNMGRDVKEFVSRCSLCDRVNTTFNATAKQLNPLPILGLFYRWGVDLAGPLNPTSSAGHKYVMGTIEHFTKFVDVTPIAVKSAATTAQVFLEKVLCRFGSCAEVITDGGTEFAGEFDELLKMNLIDHRRTAPYHPQAGGLAERAVQTIKRALKKLCEESQTPELWDKTMPWLVFGCNCSHQAPLRCRHTSCYMQGTQSFLLPRCTISPCP